MKELTIEQKAQKYDKALAKARTIVNSINVGLIGKDSFEAVFPELKENKEESTDEKVRKALIKLVTNHASMDLFIEYDIHLDEALSWLEKQGEQKPADNIESSAQNKPWSEEDERLFQIVIDILDRQNHLRNISHTDLIACVRKLKSLRPSSQWEPSDEQMKVLTAISSKEILSGYERGMIVGLYTELQKLRGE